MAAHEADGYGLEFTSRTSWKARRYISGKHFDNVPVTWTKGFRHDRATKTTHLEVWYQDAGEMKRQLASSDPFVVALAVAKDYNVMPHAFQEFRGVFLVRPTGKELSQISIETLVLKRMKAPEEK